MLATLLTILTVIGSFTPGTKDGKLLEATDIAGKSRIRTVISDYHWGPGGELLEGRKPDEPGYSFRCHNPKAKESSTANR